jgi:hypothetical protein
MIMSNRPDYCPINRQKVDNDATSDKRLSNKRSTSG